MAKAKPRDKNRPDLLAGAAYVRKNADAIETAKTQRILNAIIEHSELIPIVVRQTMVRVKNHFDVQAEVKNQSIEHISSLLGKRSKHPSIFRYLASRPDGVTFTEFMEYRIPGTGHRLTESTDPENISSMLKVLSKALKPHGWKISIRKRSNLILASKILERSRKQ